MNERRPRRKFEQLNKRLAPVSVAFGSIATIDASIVAFDPYAAIHRTGDIPVTMGWLIKSGLEAGIPLQVTISTVLILSMGLTLTGVRGLRRSRG